MIPIATKAVEVDNLPSVDGEEEVKFTIGNAAWVMKSLSKLYSNAVLAVIREYSTNARDAHIEAGKLDAAVKVTLPTLYHPFFEIEDFGVGMSKETLKDVYTRFGDSTKRETNDANGMLGFGCKSALAYTDSFIVVSRKDGIETEALIVRKADWSITLRVTAQRATTEPNGTKVQIPARDYDAFRNIAMDFYRFWEPGTVEVDGKYPEWAVGEKLDDNLYFSKSQGTSYVVMGNVAYRIANPEALFQNRGMNSISFVAYVPNGSVEFTPSREDLEYTETTKKTLHGVIENFEKKILKQAKTDIDTATDYFDAYGKWVYWTNKLGKGPFGDLEFRGEKFTNEIQFDGYRYRPAEQRYNMYAIKTWSVSSMDSTLIVVGMPAGTPSSHHKSRAKKYRNIIGVHSAYILFTSAPGVDSVWVDPKRVVSWDKVKEATKPPRQPRDLNRPKRVKGTFDYTTKDGDRWEEELPDTKHLYYIAIQAYKAYSVGETLRLTDDSKAVVIRLAANRIEKFKRDNPQAKCFITEFRAKVNLNGVDFLDNETREALAVGHDTRAWLNALDVSQIDDPEFTRIKDLLAVEQNTRLKAYNDAYRLANAMRMAYNFKQHNIIPSNEDLLREYPMLQGTSPRYSRMAAAMKDEYVFYINAKYAASRAAKKGN